MTTDELKKRKQQLAMTNEELSQLSGVPLGTVQKVMSGATRFPRRETLRALEKVLFPETVTLRKSAPYPASHGSGDLLLSEAAPNYLKKRQGEYTVEDYLALPEDQRMELIDGVLYTMYAPVFVHQQILVEIAVQLRMQMDRCPHDCVLSVAPTDVQLDRDERTMVQPDILIICDREKIRRERVFGAPDFAIEILSPSTERKDLIIKTRKYQNAGVREYWVIDPDSLQILQYDFSGKSVPQRFYSFDQQVPVLISEGRCTVDFGLIRERIAPFMEDPAPEDI